MKIFIKRSMAAILVVVMLLSAAPLSGFVGFELTDCFGFKTYAETEYISGIFKYHLSEDEKTVVITGCTIEPKKDLVGVLTIPSKISEKPVVCIGSLAFYGYTEITKLFLPEGLKSIEYNAFLGCSGLTEVVFPESLEKIGFTAFKNCRNLSRINYPVGVTDAGDNIFARCERLTEIIVPEGIKEIPAFLFHGASYLQKIQLPSTLESINASAFYNCSSLKSIDLPDKLKSIEYNAFFGCSGLTEVIFPEALEKIGFTAFKNCRNLSRINYPVSVTDAGDNIFAGCEKLTEITVPEGIKEIPAFLFHGASYLQKIQLPSTLESINASAFYNCSSLKSIDLPDKLKSIEYNAFFGCSELTEVYFPKSIEKIGFTAFKNCRNLSRINYPVGVTDAGDNIFAGCEKLTEITIPEGIKEIPAYLFYGATFLQSIILPYSLTKIGMMSFDKCDSLTDVYYAGKESDWSNISIGSNNDPLINAMIHFNGSPPESTDADTIFSGISTQYNHELARFCADFSLYGYNMSSINDKLNDVGFTLIKKDDNADRDEVNYFIASKDEVQNGTTKKIIFVGCIGSHKKQWYSNFDPSATERDKSADRGGAPYASNSTEAHLGFADAQEYVYYNLSNYIKELNDNGVNSENIKVFLTGHSRGAAVANLLAARLVNEQNLSTALVKSGNIYAYTFATPRPTTDKNSSMYNCIFNIVNPEDMVTKVMLEKWGYNRYGVTYSLPSRTNDKNWKTYLSTMRVYYKDYKGNEYEPYPNGEKATYKIINQMGKNVKSPAQLYTEEFNATWYLGWEFKLTNKWTTFDFFKKTLLPFVAEEEVDWGALVGVALGPGFFFSNILFYFASPDADMPKNISKEEMAGLIKETFGNRFREAHEAETYYAYMHALTEEQLTENRKGYKGTVNCPVDIEIYDKETGELVGRIVNNTIDEEVASKENSVVMSVDGDSKEYWLPSNGSYTVKLIGNDNGTMDYTVSEIDSDIGEIGRINFYDVEIIDGCTFTSEVIAEEMILDEYTLTSESGEMRESDEMILDDLQDIKIDIQVDGSGVVTESMIVTKGDYVTVSAQSNSDSVFVGWHEGSTLVSTDITYSFVAKSNCVLIAKFKAAEVKPETNGKIHSVKIGNISLNYRDSDMITPTISVDSGVKYTVEYSSSDSGIAAVDENGKVTATGTGNATITVTVTDQYGNVVTDTCGVSVNYTWWQWIIVIVLFGWIWY